MKSRQPAALSRFDNTTKIVLITFLARLYFYIHINTLYLQTRGLNLLEVTSLESIIILSVFLAEVPTGVIADRIGRKWSVVLALLLQAVGEVLYLFSETYLFFAVIAMIAGVGFAFASGATESLIYDSLPEDDREEAMKRAMGVGIPLAFLAISATILLAAVFLRVDRLPFLGEAVTSS